MQKRCRIIYNPTSGREAMKNNLVDILNILERAGYETSAYATTPEPNSAKNEAERAAKAGFNLIVAAGGDGTMNEAVSGLEKKLAELREQEGEQTQILSKWDTEIEKILQQQSYEQKDLDRVRGDLERRKAELAEIDEAIAKNDETIQTGTDRIRELGRQLADSDQDKDEGRKALTEKNEQKDRLRERLRSQIGKKDERSA